MFNSLKPFVTTSKPIRIQVATGDANSNLTALGIGMVKILNHNNTLLLQKCLYVPKLKCNLISLLELLKKQLTVSHTNNVFSLSANGKEFMYGNIIGKLMVIDYTIPKAILTNKMNDPWHERLGHPRASTLKHLGLPRVQNKQVTQAALQSHFEPALLTLDCVHMDMVGPINTQSISGKQYFLTIVDQASSFKIIAMENSQERKLKKPVSDRGGEFINNNFKKLSEEGGFVHIMSPPETPQHNVFAEQANCTILEKARCLLAMSNIPALFGLIL
ncbi:hypothetical protein O181_064841 [Austropuccinia psidii MF-1]|uniref:Integrase catalytic domain-containing protein n=1 Tax=Austropuccinia psidii MF-1 TaxID=1389203 RepID=A0A9Q3EUI9_9BASI|nr:hypothetical protein [Austropuccinia psidii MF-1]